MYRLRSVGTILTDSAWTVSTLLLSSNLLDGPIPSEFGLLVNLNLLQLFNNALTSSIPSTLGSLSQLQILWLYSNNLTGSVLEELC
jgi:Leucine-rich repeat (LRR) protein